jgi:alcohol dehydrogenase YqhD (iron-dependent ADH family)
MRFFRWAIEVWRVEPDYFNPERTIRSGISSLRSFYRTLGMPVSLSEIKIGKDRFREMALKATGNATRTVGNFVKLTADDIISIYNRAL